MNNVIVIKYGLFFVKSSEGGHFISNGYKKIDGAVKDLRSVFDW